MDYDLSTLILDRYKERIQQKREVYRLQNQERALKLHELKRPLPERIKEWYEQLSEEDQRRPYSMQELVDIFNKSPAQLGIALHSLNWIRNRSFKKGEVFARTWHGPAKETSEK